MEVKTPEIEKHEKPKAKLSLESVKVGDIKPYPKNAKLHPKAQIGKIRDSIINFGYNDPIALDEHNEIIEGHGRLEALKQINADPNKEIQIIRLTGMDEPQKKAYRIAHNKLNLDTGFDLDILKDEFYSLEDTDHFEDTGFSREEITEVWDEDKEAKEDGVIDPDKPAKYKIQEGEIWQLGNHRLMCGDATNKEHISTLLAGEVAHLMVTDPPYGVNYDPNWRNEADKKAGNKSYPTRAIGEVPNDQQIDWRETWALINCPVAYLWHAGRHAKIVQESLEATGYEIKSQIIWVKPHFAISRGDYHWKHEPCFYAVKKGEKHNWNGSRNETTVWEIAGMNAMGGTKDPADERTGHSTQKPIECMSKPIKNNSFKDQIIIDPFGGSGSTLIACEQLSRKCLMMEIDPKYCSTIIERWEKLTEKEAKKI